MKINKKKKNLQLKKKIVIINAGFELSNNEKF